MTASGALTLATIERAFERFAKPDAYVDWPLTPSLQVFTGCRRRARVAFGASEPTDGDGRRAERAHAGTR